MMAKPSAANLKVLVAALRASVAPHSDTPTHFSDRAEKDIGSHP